jgi:hypothetical protein
VSNAPTSDERRQELNPPFVTLDSLVMYYVARLSQAAVEEVIQREKAVFIIRRDTPLSDTHGQFLCRVHAVLESMVQGKELPDLPIFIGDVQALPQLR